ncbi:MAG: hypothetical protein J6P57_00620 [Lachnospiraceae bacterium]|nr:hypothetical protein [Lachnospiraceae bacterium]
MKKKSFMRYPILFATIFLIAVISLQALRIFAGNPVISTNISGLSITYDSPCSISNQTDTGFDVTVNGYKHPTCSNYNSSQIGNLTFINDSSEDIIISFNYSAQSNGTWSGKIGTTEMTASGSVTNLVIPANSSNVAMTITSPVGEGSVRVSVTNINLVKIDQTVTAPMAVSGLTYTGSAQTLISAAVVTEGNQTAGSITYSLDNSTYSTELPTGTNVGTYSVYYKVAGNDKYNDFVCESPVSVSIGKATQKTTAPIANSLIYTGSSQALVTAGTVTGGKLVYSTDNEAWSETIPTGKDAGSYTVYYKVKGDDNYNETEEQKIDVTIQPKSLTITADAKSKKAGDKDPALTYTSEGLVDGDSITGALTRKEGETAGTYAIAVGTLTAGDNYKIEFKGADLTITAADIITYTNTEGNGSNWTAGSDGTLEFKFSRSVNDSETIKHFTGIKVDDTVVDSSNYTYKAGSVIVNLKSEYLAKLSEGKHTLTALFDDGDDVTVSFEISAKAKQDDNKQTTVDTPTTKNDTPKKDTPKKDTPKAPTTGDKINMGIIVMLMIDSCLAALYLTLKRKQIK